jgi:DNA-binding transcriptional ArsR family regulator
MILKEEKRFLLTGQTTLINNNMENQFQQIAMLIGDKSRSSMLWNLLDGRAYTATELSLCADISAQAASNHLLKLVESNILKVEKQGRHRYYRYATEDVARIMETLAGLSSVSKKENREVATGIKYARSCYDHIAGKFGVDILNALLKKKIIQPCDGQYELTNTGGKWFYAIDINVDELYLKKRSFAYPCLDWSERKHHVAGALGASLLHAFINKDWVRRIKHSRELIVTAKGRVELEKRLELCF